MFLRPPTSYTKVTIANSISIVIWESDLKPELIAPKTNFWKGKRRTRRDGLSARH
jgi:hypothetical protein